MGHCVRLLRAHNRLFDTVVSAFSGYLGLFGIVKISQNPPNFPASNPDAESRKFLKDLEASEKVRNILKLDSRLPRSSKVQGFSKYRVLNRFALTLKTHAQVRPSLTKKRQERSLLIPVQSRVKESGQADLEPVPLMFANFVPEFLPKKIHGWMDRRGEDGIG